MSISPTPNPLKHVLNAIGEDVEWLTYGTVSIGAVRLFFSAVHVIAKISVNIGCFF